jgi:uncharacterized membrane protein
MRILLEQRFLNDSHTSMLIERLALLAVVVIALFARLHAISDSAIWYDEAYSLLLARETPIRILALTALDVHPPLYYLLLHYWSLVWGQSPLAARSLSALFDVGTLLLCLKLMSLIASRRATCVAALLLVLLPISLRYSQEARMYTLLAFWLMGATVALVLWVLKPQKKRFAVLYGVLMTAALYTHYFAALCVMAHWVWWGTSELARDSIPVRKWLLVNSAIVLLFGPWVPFLLVQMHGNPSTDWMAALSWASALTLVWQVVIDYDAQEAFSFWRVSLPVFLVLCALAITHNKQGRPQSTGLLVACFFVPTAVLLIVSVFKTVLHYRYLYFTAMVSPMMVAVFLDRYWPGRRALITAVLMLLLLFETQALISRQQTSQRYGRPALMAAQINVQYRSSDEILTNNLFWYLPFVYYNQTPVEAKVYVGKFAQISDGFPEHFGWALLADKKRLMLDDDALGRLNAKRIWWITHSSVIEAPPFFSGHWKKTLTVNGGEVEARLFVRE